MAKLSLSDLREIRSREEKNLKKRDIHGREIHVVVAMGTSGINAGAKLTLNSFLKGRTGFRECMYSYETSGTVM